MTTHHAIVGDGLTAAEFAASARLQAGDTLTIIGPNVAAFGRGVAYASAPADAPWRYAYLLNSPCYAVDPDFAQWIPQNREWLIEQMRGRRPDWLAAGEPWLASGDLASLNAPREIYGDFCARRTTDALARLRAADINVTLVEASVTDIAPTGDGLNLALNNGQSITANSIDVATGGPVNQRFDGDCGARAFAQLFGHEEQIAEQLGPRGRIICIGANATMLDLLRFCQSIQQERDIQFTALSLRGVLPEPLIPSPSKSITQLELKARYSTADEFLQDLVALKDKAQAAGDNFEALRAGLRHLFMQTSLTTLLPNIEDARKVARPLYRTFQGGTRDSIHDFQRLAQSGNTRMLTGEVISIESSASDATVVYRDHTGAEQRLSADVVVNCAGPGRISRFDPFTTKMIERGWISNCPHSGGIVVGARCNTTIPGIRYFGPAVTTIGDTPLPIPFYDALRIRLTVQALNNPAA